MVKNRICSKTLHKLEVTRANSCPNPRVSCFGLWDVGIKQTSWLFWENRKTQYKATLVLFSKCCEHKVMTSLYTFFPQDSAVLWVRVGVGVLDAHGHQYTHTCTHTRAQIHTHICARTHTGTHTLCFSVLSSVRTRISKQPWARPKCISYCAAGAVELGTTLCLLYAFFRCTNWDAAQATTCWAWAEPLSVGEVGTTPQSPPP